MANVGGSQLRSPSLVTRRFRRCASGLPKKNENERGNCTATRVCLIIQSGVITAPSRRVDRHATPSSTGPVLTEAAARDPCREISVFRRPQQHRQLHACLGHAAQGHQPLHQQAPGLLAVDRQAATICVFTGAVAGLTASRTPPTPPNPRPPELFDRQRELFLFRRGFEVATAVGAMLVTGAAREAAATPSDGQILHPAGGMDTGVSHRQRTVLQGRKRTAGEEAAAHLHGSAKVSETRTDRCPSTEEINKFQAAGPVELRSIGPDRRHRRGVGGLPRTPPQLQRRHRPTRLAFCNSRRDHAGLRRSDTRRGCRPASGDTWHHRAVAAGPGVMLPTAVGVGRRLGEVTCRRQ